MGTEKHRRENGSHPWDSKMTGILRGAAEVREARESRRSREDAAATEKETAALLDAIHQYRRAESQLGAPTPSRAAGNRGRR